MTNINLLFTCPLGGKNDGTPDNHPLQPPLTQRDDDNFIEDKCRSSYYLYQAIIFTILKILQTLRQLHLARALDPVYHNKLRLMPL